MSLEATVWRPFVNTPEANSIKRKANVEIQILAHSMRKATQKAWSESEGAVIAALQVCYWFTKDMIVSVKYSSLID